MVERRTDSGIELQSVYGPGPGPGEFPFTRGVYREMYRERLWTMRQYAGFGTAQSTNERFRYLLAKGQTGLSCAFDLPTQMGYDSDHERAEGEVGRVGVAIDSLEDMETLLADLPLGEISTSMTINSTAPILLLLYQLTAEGRGIPANTLRGTIQNDILKEYIARGTYIYPPKQSMRLITDTFAYCKDELPQWNTISISGYHIREAGSTAAQEVAFTIANGIAYVEAALNAGLAVDEFAPRLSFFWNGHNNFFEEVAKFRVARRVWATIMRDRFNAQDERSCAMRFHVQTAGSTLVAQQPENNVARVALQALAAVMGGTQSLHTNAADEAFGLPTEHSASVALRTQQIIGYETGVADVADPLGGSYLVESLTDELETRINGYLEQIEARGGAVGAIEANYPQDEIEQAALSYARAVDRNEQIVVGLNQFTEEGHTDVEVFPLNPALQRNQLDRLARLHQERANEEVAKRLADVEAAARGTQNLLFPMKAALAARATLGEVSDVLRTVFGSYEQE